MLFRDLVTKCRNYLVFDGAAAVPEELLHDLVELACYAPSRDILQPFGYIAVSDPSGAGALVSMLLPDGSFPGWTLVPENSRPVAFIIMLGDLRRGTDFGPDSGVAAQTILLGATDAGYGGCIVASFEATELSRHFRIPHCYVPLLVIALGKPSETVVIDRISSEDPAGILIDANGIRHVPGRMPEDVLLKIR